MQPAAADEAVVNPAGAGGGARAIWAYRNDGPYEPNQTPYVRLNGQIAWVCPADGLYRRPSTRCYTVAVDSYGAPYPNQFAEFNLGAGQEAFVKVSSMREKVGGEGVALRTLFFTQLVPPDFARPMIAGTPFYGSS